MSLFDKYISSCPIFIYSLEYHRCQIFNACTNHPIGVLKIHISREKYSGVATLDTERMRLQEPMTALLSVRSYYLSMGALFTKYCHQMIQSGAHIWANRNCIPEQTGMPMQMFMPLNISIELRLNMPNITQCSHLAWYNSDISHIQYNINTFLIYDFNKLY